MKQPIQELIEAVKSVSNPYLTTTEFAEEFQMSESTQSKMRSAKSIPYHKIGSYVRYKREDIYQWLNEAKVV